MAKEELKTSLKHQKQYQDQDSKLKLPHKIVIRHLPPTMTEEEFLKQTEPLPEHDFYYFAAADWSLGVDATCRAYITVKNYNDIFLFRDRFDGYVFVDNRGNEYPAIVEFAPFQGVLKNKSRGGDNKVNTIELESHYQEFLKKLEEERETLAKGGEGKLEFNLERKKEEIVSTPLLQYLANKKEKRREEAKKRTTEKKRQKEEEQVKLQQQKQEKSTAKQAEAKNIRDQAAASTNNKSTEKEENKGGSSKGRNDRRAERNRRRSEEFKKRLEEQQQQQQQQQQNSGTPNNNTNKKEEHTDKKENRRHRRDHKEKERDKERERKEQPTTSTSNPQKPVEILKKPGELNDSVRNFIYQAAQHITKPTEVSATEEEKDDTLNMSNNKKEEDAVVGVNYEEKIVQQNVDSKNVSEGSDGGETAKVANINNDLRKQSEQQLQQQQQQQREKREEKRIRNKDRPSIAIYQPKARLRMTEESDNNSVNKEGRSQPTSDGEVVVKKEEQQIQQQQQQQPSKHKRVQRYSERTRNRQKSLPKEIKNPDPEIKDKKSEEEEKTETKVKADGDGDGDIN